MAGLNELLEEQTAQAEQQLARVGVALASLHDDYDAACVLKAELANRLTQAPREAQKTLKVELKKVEAQLDALEKRRAERSAQRQRLLKELGGLQMALVAS